MASAAETASSTVVAGRPSGTGIPWRAKSCLPWYSSRSMSTFRGVSAWPTGPSRRGSSSTCSWSGAGKRGPDRLSLAAGLRLRRPVRRLALLLLLRRAGVLQLDADEMVRDRVAVADPEPPTRGEVLVQPPEADRERDCHEHLVDEEPEDAVGRRDPVAGDQVDERAVDDADDRPCDHPDHRGARDRAHRDL